MKINRKSWHAKSYFWFTESDWVQQVNLCPYVRTVFIWAPLTWLFVRGWLWRIPVPAISWFSLWAAIHAVLYHFSPAKTLKTLAIEGIVALSVGLLVGGFFFIYSIIERKKKRYEEWLRAQMTEDEWDCYMYAGRMPDRLRKSPEPESRLRMVFRKIIDALLDAIELIAEYVSAAHKKICPIIRIE